jgi:FkbM family methyltransferase
MNLYPHKTLNFFLKLVRSLCPLFCFKNKPPTYHKMSYSQEGEDLVLNRIFEDKDYGFYVDVGAHHPERYSNTYFFYKKGWMGINIDAMPGSMSLFNSKRPRDINLELAVMESRGARTYFKFNEPALNSFSKTLSKNRSGLGNYKILEQVEIIGMPLSQILNDNNLKGHKIDFLSIDVEGLDFEVLKSNDWSVHRPYIVLVEILESRLEEIQKDPICLFMKMHGYHLYAKTLNTVFFKCNS